jgi:hypothetical protein
MRERTILAALAAAFVLAGPPAAALEPLGGVWAGTIRCKGGADGAPFRQVDDLRLTISETPPGVVAESISTFVGFALADASDEGRGWLTLVQCGLDTDPEGGFSFEGSVIHAKVKTRAESLRATLRGSLISMDETRGIAAECKLKLKRVGPHPGGLVGGC